jgi:hypothetical protein
MKNGVVLSSFTDASRSIILPFFLKTTKRIICAVKPRVSATRIVTILFSDSVSSTSAKSIKTMIVKEGGTNSVEMNLASLSDVVFKIR